MTRFSLIRPLAATVATMALSACALLSTPDPVQTYRFGGAPVATSAAAVASPVQVTLRRVEFPEAVEGDKLLGVTGTEAAYIAGARWVSPASDLYMESIENAFAAQATRVRLIGARELTRGQRSLDIDIRSFEARYDAPGATPTIVVTARTLWSWLVYFGSSRETMVMGRYATLLLLRARLRRFRAELLRIAGLLALFGAILWLHWVWL